MDTLFKINAAAMPSVNFLLWRMDVHEELGRPFRIDLELFCEKGDVSAEKMLGSSLTVEINKPTGGKRYFNGLVARYAYAGERGRYRVYLITLRPWLWFLTRTADCRIFQQLSIKEILPKIFKDKNGFSDYKLKVQGTYKTWDYKVQYRESDFDFVSRIMEQEGIYYYFEHEDGKHTMTLVDSASSHAAMDGNADLPFRTGGQAQVGQEHIHEWLRTLEVQTATFVMKDYDFEKPKANLEVRSQIRRQHPLASFEVYDYPGDYSETADGNQYAKTRIDELQSQYLRATAKGASYNVAVGKKFKLTDFPRRDENMEYLIVGGHYDISSGEIEQFTGDSQNRFAVTLDVMDASQTFRPRQLTPKPSISGPQTAVVVGKEGEEIWTDKFGRVKVQFHWDREGKNDENSSCWVRVGQVWAGKDWGAIHIPRIGQEVIIDFLEGDPDKPIITGRVYNNDVMPPYTLPANATQSGIKSRTSKEGTAENFNELRFEDKKDAEEVYFHAERDFNRVVENNDTLKVGFDKKKEGDQTIEIFNNQTLKVGTSEAKEGNQTIEIWKDRTETVKTGNEKVTIEKGNRDVIVSTGNDTHLISKGNREVTVDTGNDTLTVAKGNLSIKVSAGMCTIEAAQSIELKVGGSSIKLEPSQITIKSAQIAVSGDAKVDMKAATVEINGSALVKVQAGVLKLN